MLNDLDRIANIGERFIVFYEYFFSFLLKGKRRELILEQKRQLNLARR
ncbi:hypothetical protein HanOQP8_Chr06g0218021 [Helianthus annuus]|nr:hypothetical protein HanOQP8_Chr06g0218021 [Helianthus annuus]